MWRAKEQSWERERKNQPDQIREKGEGVSVRGLRNWMCEIVHYVYTAVCIVYDFDRWRWNWVAEWKLVSWSWECALSISQSKSTHSTSIINRDSLILCFHFIVFHCILLTRLRALPWKCRHKYAVHLFHYNALSMLINHFSFYGIICNCW